MTNAIETLASPILPQILDASLPQSLVAGGVCAGAYAAAYFTSWLGGYVWRWIDDTPKETFINHPVLKGTSKFMGFDSLEYLTTEGTWVGYKHSKEGVRVHKDSSYLSAFLLFGGEGVIFFFLLPIILWLILNYTGVFATLIVGFGGVYLARSARRTQKTLKAHMEDIQAHKKIRK